MPFKDPEKRKEYHREYYRKYMNTIGKKYRIKAENKRQVKQQILKEKGAIQYKLLRVYRKYGDLGVQILLRDNFQCVECGESDFRILAIHHIIPRSKGGKDIEENLELRCLNCHERQHFMLDIDTKKDFPQEDWDVHWMEFAVDLSQYANCYSRQIGSVIVNNNILRSVGWNGPPDEIPTCETRNPNEEKVCPRKLLGCKSGERIDLCNAVHSEVRSILRCPRKYLKNGTLYLDCDVVCNSCMAIIIQSGISRIVCNTTQNTTGNVGIYYDFMTRFLNENFGLKLDSINLERRNV